jgi:hypothetical protein
MKSVCPVEMKLSFRRPSHDFFLPLASPLPEDISPDVFANDSWTERYSQALAEGAEAREPGTQMPEFFSESASGNSAGNADEADLQADAGTLSGSGAAAVKETAAEKKESWPNRNRGKNKKRR